MSFCVRWSDGTSLDYKAWVEGEPNDFNGEEKCVEMYHFDEYKGMKILLH